MYIYTGSAMGLVKEIFGNLKNPLAGNTNFLFIKPFY